METLSLRGKTNLNEKISKKVKIDKFHQVIPIAWNTLGNRLFMGLSHGDFKAIEVIEEGLIYHHMCRLTSN